MERSAGGVESLAGFLLLVPRVPVVQVEFCTPSCACAIAKRKTRWWKTTSQLSSGATRRVDTMLEPPRQVLWAPPPPSQKKQNHLAAKQADRKGLETASVQKMRFFSAGLNIAQNDDNTRRWHQDQAAVLLPFGDSVPRHSIPRRSKTQGTQGVTEMTNKWQLVGVTNKRTRLQQERRRCVPWNWIVDVMSNFLDKLNMARKVQKRLNGKKAWVHESDCKTIGRHDGTTRYGTTTNLEGAGWKQFWCS